MKNRFNLVEEPWIPVAGKGLVSLASVFSDDSVSALGGNPVQKIALTKLLLAIAQAAYTPTDKAAWESIGAAGMAKKVLAYLNDKKDLFWLYGDKPFLQMQNIKQAESITFGAVQAHVATGNTTVLSQIQAENPLSDSEKAILIIQLMGFGLGGKKTDNSVVLSKGYQLKTNEKGKPATGKPGPSLGFQGFLHSFLVGLSLQETIWLNLFTLENIEEQKYYTEGIGIAPWEKMPEGEDCNQSKLLRYSYIGRLIPLSRFVLLAEDGIHYSEGILHLGYAESMVDPSVAVDFSLSKPKVLWVDPEKRPWRQLTALLSFIGVEKKGGFDCLQLRQGLLRYKESNKKLGIWSGGLRVSSNAGEQYVSGVNDYVESEVQLDTSSLGEIWFINLKQEMDALDSLSKMLYGATLAYYKSQKVDGKNQAAQASNLFWQLCEQTFQELVNTCDPNSGRDVKTLRPVFAGFARKAYDTYCARDTARQLDAWAANNISLGKYLI